MAKIIYGFSDYFKNSKLKIKDLIINFKECPNLNFISSGNISQMILNIFFR